MKYKYVFLLFISILSLAWHPYTHRMTLAEKELKGPAETVYELVNHGARESLIEQKFNREGKLKEIKYFFHNPFYKVDSTTGRPFQVGDLNNLDLNEYYLSHLYRYQYNDNGDLEEEYLMGKDSILHYKKNFYYNSNDSLNRVDFWSYDSVGIVNDSLVTKFSYVINGNIHQRIRTDNNDTITKYKYWYFDQQNRLVKTLSNLESVSPFWHTFDEYRYNMFTFEYDTTGVRKATHVIIDSLFEKRELISNTEFRHNKEGQLIEKYEEEFSDSELESKTETLFYYKEGKLFRKSKIRRYIYNEWKPEKDIMNIDEAGNVQSYISITKLDTTVYSFDRQYDEYDNWIKTKEYKNGKPYKYHSTKDSIIRKIEYYQ